MVDCGGSSLHDLVSRSLAFSKASYLHSQQGVWNEEQHGPPMQTEDGACCFPALFEIEDIKMEGWLAEGLGLIQKLQHSQSERDAGVML